MEDEQQHAYHKWSNNLSLFLFSVGAHTFINKYVLSVLEFQYPTVFISWQCGSCVVLLMSGYALGYIDLASIDSSLIKVWFPGMVLHTGIMYAGSVSLSKLAIPIFLGLQNLTYWFTEIVMFWKSKKIPSVRVQLSLLLIGFGAVYLLYLDITRDFFAYKWVLIYVICSGFYLVFSEVRKDIKLSCLDKAYYNSLFSVASLMLLSILTGEWRKTMDFPFLYYIRFHVGSICSGLLCCLTAVVLNILPKETSSEMTEAGTTLNRALFSFFAFGVFETKLDVSVALSITMLLLGGMTYTYLKLKESTLQTEDLKNIKL